MTTKAKAESDESLVTRVYDVGELADVDFGGGLGGGGGFFSLPMLQMGGPGMRAGGTAMGGGQAPAGGQQPLQSVPELPFTLATMVIEMTSPSCRWLTNDGEGGAVRLVGASLVVRQTYAGHREVWNSLRKVGAQLSVL